MEEFFHLEKKEAFLRKEKKNERATRGSSHYRLWRIVDYREIWVAKWLHRVEHTHTHTHTSAQTEKRQSERACSGRPETVASSLLPPFSFFFFLSRLGLSLSLSLSIFLPPLSFCHGRVRTADFHATISAFRCAAIIGRCERKLVSLGQSFRGVVVAVAVGGGGGGGLAQSPISKFRRESRRLFNELLHASSWSLRSINGHYATESFLL